MRRRVEALQQVKAYDWERSVGEPQAAACDFARRAKATQGGIGQGCGGDSGIDISVDGGNGSSCRSDEDDGGGDPSAERPLAPRRLPVAEGLARRLSTDVTVAPDA